MIIIVNMTNEGRNINYEKSNCNNNYGKWGSYEG